MKKFLLMLAMMLPCLGAWAQTPVVQVSNIGTAPFQLSDEDAAKIFELDNLTVVLDVTTAATLSGRGAFFCVADPKQPIPTSFPGTNTSYMACGHNGAGIAYIAAANGGQHFSTGTIPANSTIRIAYVFDKTNNKFKSYIGDTNTAWTQDRNFNPYEIATPKMVKEDFENAKIYIGGGMAGDANHELGDATVHCVRVFDGTLDINAIKALDKIVINTADDFKNGKIYTFVTERGWMGAKDDNDNVISTVYTANGVTGSKDNANFQWTVYKSENDNYYLYNLGKGMFMGKQSNNNTAVPFVATPDTKGLVFKTSNSTEYPMMFSTDNVAVVNHSANHASGVVSWTGGWNNLTDEGSNHKVELVAELDNATLTKIEDAVAAYELTNTYEVSLLDAAIAKANTLFGQITIGSNVGEYSSTDPDYQATFNEIKEFREGIENTSTPASVQEKVNALEDLIASFSINQPKKGKFYRLKNNQSNWYATSTVHTEGTHKNKLYMKEAGNTAESVWYLTEDNKFISYKEGRYLGDMSSDWSFEAIGANGNVVTFNESAVVGKYQIIPSNGRALYGDQVRVDAAGDGNKSGNYAWTIEEVTWLPIPVNVEAGYTTIYSPVELALSYNRFKAYTVSETSATYATLVEQTVVPAGVGVVLELQQGAEVVNDCVFLEVKATETTNVTSVLLGTYADEFITNDAYVLTRGDGDDKVVFGTALKNQQGDTSWLNNGFKAYLPAEGITSLVLRFNFGGNTTAIESIVAPSFDANAPIYDLSGRRVVNAVKGGLYIQNGKKFIVR